MTLKEWRKSKKLNQKEVALKLDYQSATTVARWEQGEKISLKDILKIEALTKGKVKYKDWVGE
jgi:transcriptional regulator with XRE-family HTH domain